MLAGTGAEELRARFREQNSNLDPEFEGGLLRISEEGAFEDAERCVVGVPLYVGGVLNGAIILRLQDTERMRLASISTR